MKLFKKKPIAKYDTFKLIVEELSQLEPKKLDRFMDLVKEYRSYCQKFDTFVNGRPDEIDKAERELEKL